jgi:hypothetical protein
MVRLIYYIIGFALMIGAGEVGVKAVMEMAGLAAHAQQHDQISYSTWNAMLWGAKPISQVHDKK